MALSSTILALQAREKEKELGLDIPNLLTAWRNDIDGVLNTIRSALEPFVKNGSTSIQYEEIELYEELLGTHAYRRLMIEIVNRRIYATPVARFTIGGSGRIDLYRDNRPSEDHRILIVRLPTDPGDGLGSWLIEQKGEYLMPPPRARDGFLRAGRRFRPLDPSAVESAIEYLLTLT